MFLTVRRKCVLERLETSVKWKKNDLMFFISQEGQTNILMLTTR